MSRVFEIITEADARQLDVGAVVELAPGGHVTPLARDTLTARRVTVVPAGSSDASLPADLAPVADIRRVAIASDHTGVELKGALVRHLRQKALAVEDVWDRGMWHDASASSKPAPIDYPDVAAAVGRAVARGEADAGIVIDGAGLGSTIAANKIRGVRAAMCTNVTLARYAREHNGANVLALGATLITIEDAKEIVDTWLATPMREARYIRRLLKIRRLERAERDG
jgi:ribose 5-phosphate isomerase B